MHMADKAKLGQNGLKMGPKHLFVHPHWSGVTFGKNAFFTHFAPIFALKTGPFQGILGFSMGQNPSLWAQNGLKTHV